jgi:predicted metal-dependent phosphoesterase TrpH
MNRFKYDMHVHTREVSPCGKVSARDVVALYKQAGYHGIVLTDHCYDGFFARFSNLSWEQQVDEYLKGYRKALESGREVGLQVILGMELRFFGSMNDYLVYGVDESFLKSTPYPYMKDLKIFHQIAKENDLLIYQAHPFRTGITRANPNDLDGIEVFNGNLRHDSRNDLALRFAQENRLLQVSGSDFHQLEDLGRGGIEITQSVKTSRELVRVLKSETGIKRIET